LLDGNAGLAEGVEHLGFAEARGVVLEGEAPGGVVYMEAAEAVKVCEFAQALPLFVAERRVEFVGDFQKCHARNYSSDERGVASGEKKTGLAQMAANGAVVKAICIIGYGGI